MVDAANRTSRLEAATSSALRGSAAVLTGEFAVPACREALASGLVINAPRPDVLRFAPSLLVSEEEVDEALGTLGRVLAGLATPVRGARA